MSEILTEAELSVKIIQNFDEATTGLVQYEELTGRVTDNIQRRSQGAKGAFNDLAGATKAATGETNANITANAAAAAAAGRTAESTDKAATSAAQYAGGLPRLRYALYDVSNTLGVAGVALLAFGGLALKTAIDYQAAFANVQRTTQTTGIAATALYQQLIGLSQTMPESFANIAQIASLGGQLGIAANDISSFAKNVIEFSTTANVSIDTTATAFGRLSALLPGVNGNFSALGSSMLKVGINSVATDQQIITIAGRLAGIGSAAGLTAGEVIGLSGALASVGVQAYQSQGTITRIFTKIIEAINGGGPALEQFAATSGMSAEAFKSAWGTDAGTTFVKLLQGINSEGSGAVQAIQDLGLKSANDIPTLLKLSQNTDIVTKALSDGTSGFKENTQMAESYAIKSSTVSAKLTELSNNFKNLTADVGGSGKGLADFIGFLSDILINVDKFVQTPMGSFLSALAVGIGLVGGTSLIAVAGFLRLAAAASAVTTADLAAGGSSGILAAAWNTLFGAATRATAARQALTAAEVEGSVAEKAATVSAEGQVAANEATAASATTAAGATNILGTSLKAVSVAGLVLIALQLGGMFADWANQASGFTTTLDSAGKALDAFDKKKIASDLGLDKAPVSGKGTQSDPLGSVASQYGSLAGRASNPGVANGQDFAGNFGLAGLGLNDIAKSVQNYDKELAALVTGGNGKKAADEFKFITDGAVAQGAKLSDLQKQFPQYAAALKLAGTAAKSSGGDVAAQAQALQDSVSAITDATDASIKMQDAMYKLGGTLQTGGNDFSEYSANGRANLTALEAVMKQYVGEANGNSQVLADNLQGLFNALTTGAKVPAASLDILSKAIANLGVAGTIPTTVDLTSLFQGFDTSATKAATSVGSAAKQVKTLVDYANDLSGVFKRSFDIRFGGQEGLDTITSGWTTLKDGIAAANANIKTYRDTMLQLTADKAVTEYWLKVAQQYGDTLRAGELQATLADQNSKLAANTTSLADAQSKASTTLDGNSAAAIANRSTILGLVGNYQDYITKLAASGASQATLQAESARLKQEFITQATQLGFNGVQLAKYAAAFDDVSTAIGRVPRNITVDTSGLSPAMVALNELQAKMNSISSTPVNVNVNPPDLAKIARGELLSAQISALSAQVLPHVSTDSQVTRNSGLLAQIAAISAKLSSNSYASGGYTGDGGKYQPAGVVHAGEFVFSQEATRSIGVGNLAFQHEMAKGGKGYASGGYVGGSVPMGTGVLRAELSPYDRQLLTDIRDNIGVTVSQTAIVGANGRSNVNSAHRRAA